MSACLLSLSVISLVLPVRRGPPALRRLAAEHSPYHADCLPRVLQRPFAGRPGVSQNQPRDQRGKGVWQRDEVALGAYTRATQVLLLVYTIYLLFQLKSHAYMYESTPQHIVDAESIPGPAAAWLDTSSSDSSSSSDSDSDSSSHSRDTVRRRMKQVLRKGRMRKSSTTSSDTGDTAAVGKSSLGPANASTLDEATSEASSRPSVPSRIPSNETNEEAVEDEKPGKRSRRHRLHRHRRRHRRHRRYGEVGDGQPQTAERPETGLGGLAGGEPRRVDFAIRHEPIPEDAAVDVAALASPSSRRPFPILRGMSVKSLTPNVFVQKVEAPGTAAQAPSGPVPRVRYGIRRTNSLPDRLGGQHHPRAPGAMLPSQVPLMLLTPSGGLAGGPAGAEDETEHLSRVASIMLLLLTTGLVAACAKFLVGSIEAVTKTSTIGEVFIGLIILPIVGNAAEHVTAIMVAMKNKMDLAIGVAVGSSIQIALFVTPLVVILGWMIGRAMTLYFSLFETVSLFVATFMVNFLVLDGRSNYLEGALLCAVYIIVAIVAFYYPSVKEVSSWGK